MLSVHHQNLSLTLRSIASWAEQPKLKFSDLLLLCTHYRMRGIAALLLTADPEPFFQDLHRSARTLMQGIKNTPAADRSAGRLQPFFDAVACEDLSAAESIARAAPTQTNPSYEYEEDHCYVRILMALFCLNARATAEQLLGRYLELLRGRDEARSQLCHAFVADDEPAFARAFEQYLLEYGERWRMLEASSGVAPEALATEAHLSVEALALLRFADRRHFKTLKEYPFVPSMCRR